MPDDMQSEKEVKQTLSLLAFVATRDEVEKSIMYVICRCSTRTTEDEAERFYR